MNPLIYSKMSRRDLLRGTAAGAALFPFLPAWPARAQNESSRFLVTCVSPNGTLHQHYRPTTAGDGFELGAVLSPLESHRSKMIVFDGLDNDAAYLLPSRGHQGTLTLLTGRRPLEGDQFREGNGQPSGWASGVSVDQYIARRREAEFPYRSLEIGVGLSATESHRTRVSFAGPGRPVSPERSPDALYERVFGEDVLTEEEMERVRLGQKSVLDFVSGDIQRIQRQRLPNDADARAKLEAHLEGIRAIELRLAANNACTAPGVAAGASTRAANLPQLTDLFFDIVASALACELTGVVTFMWAQETGGPTFTWLGHETDHHRLSHASSGVGFDQNLEILQWYAGKIAGLMDRLEAVSMGEQSLADRGAVLWTSAMGNAWIHQNYGVPAVLLGGANGGLRGGRYVKYGDLDPRQPQRAHGGRHFNDLLVSLCHLMGLRDVDAFGEEGFSSPTGVDADL